VKNLEGFSMGRNETFVGQYYNSNISGLVENSTAVGDIASEFAKAQ
jgi:hypothetical protein